MILKILLKNPQETLLLGELIAKKSFKNEVIALSGELGAGKTTFAQGFAKGLGINSIITSPTFTLVKSCFETSLPFYHIDAYRLEGSKQNLGFDEYIEGNGVCLIEWPEFIANIIPDEYLKITLSKQDDMRLALLEGNGNKYITILEEINLKWQSI